MGPGLDDALVPTMLLQPLVENAIRHGISRVREPGYVRVTARARDGRLQLTVRDTGPGVQPGAESTGNGIGLANTRARLEQLYGGDYTMELENVPEGGARVVLELPLRVGTAELVLPEPPAAARTA